MHNIREHILKHTKAVEVFITEKPDLVFSLPNGKKFAVEVETGENLRVKKKLREKINQLQLDYRKNWIIVLSDSWKLKEYQIITKRVILRNQVPQALEVLFAK